MVDRGRRLVKRHPVPAATREQQTRASDPAASAWVSANAGSGKTYVLALRAIKLMLAGVPPARILCLTFTKAAAAHMANVVLDRLAEWVRLDDDALDAELATIDTVPPSPERRSAARRLFAAALETPGGLKVQTIHAFCDRVLHQFPYEARVPAGFEVLEEVGETDLLARARADVLIAASADREAPLGRALATAVAIVSDQGLAGALDEAVRERRKLLRFMAFYPNADQALAAALGLKPEEKLAAVEAEMLASANLPRSEWASVAATLVTLGGNAAKCGEALAVAAAGTLDDYLAVFTTADGDPRTEGGFGSATARGKEPALFARLAAERDRLHGLLDRRRAAMARERTSALLALAAATIHNYEADKLARGLLDYDDLVTKTVDLLHNHDSAWVHYKLDGGIDHILIDEAQDTSPEQWRVIEQLAAEFFAGRGAREDRGRTIFAVGDEKQSIFSFQGADPKRFDEMQRAFAARAGAAAAPFHPVRLDLSFRSAPPILGAVDAIFSRDEAYRGLSSDPARHPHQAIRDNAPALVEIWDTTKPDDDGDGELAWDAPLNVKSEQSPEVKLAARIAKAVAHWLAGGISVGEDARAPRPGDVIILVRRRGALFEAILRALKQAKLPVAGADRLVLADHIAVQDLIALGDALLLAADDLALASALKSPLIGLSEEALFDLAHGRQGTLAAALAASKDATLADAAALVARWRGEARTLPPFDFYARVLGRDRGRKRLLARLGHEAADAIDEFLARALAFESRDTPTLAAFLAHLRRAGGEVKRDLEVASNAIRVMTAHGVKGLEAPVVVLADTTSIPDGRHDPKLLYLPVPGALPEAPQAPVWTLNRKDDSAALAATRETAAAARDDEYRRLLYVALTRAADALVVCGYETAQHAKAGLKPGCWYQLVREALKNELAPVDVPYSDEKVWRWRGTTARATAIRAEDPAPAIEVPAWLGKAASTAMRVPRGLRPSSIVFAERRQPTPGVLDRITRGILVHRLLQYLPAYAHDGRRAAAERFLAALGNDLDAALRTALADEAMAVLASTEAAHLFGPSSRGEVPILARIAVANGETIEVPGRIDRLAVTDEAVLIGDFKTDARPPARAEDVPEPHLMQLALYRAAVERMFGKPVRASLLYTNGPVIHRISSHVLDAALKRVTSLDDLTG
jgi:ATP-dependent helicase/nuclease subunit A